MIMIRTITVNRWENCSSFWAYQLDFQKGNSDKPAHSLAVAGAEPDLSCRRVVLLLSRLPKRTRADDKWLASVREAVEWAGKQNYTVVSSVGLIGWEYITWYAARRKIPVWIVLPPDRLSGTLEKIQSIISRLELDEKSSTFLQPLSDDKLTKAHNMHLRDMVAFNLAHYRLPIALRKGSYWNDLAENADDINHQFETRYPGRPKPGWLHLREDCSNPIETEDIEYLIHWTRGVYGPWPGESEADYFTELLESESGNPRDGFNTLKQIISSGVLRGEGRMIRAGEPTISFTSSPPCYTLKNIRYRSALGHWNYEPYGIAIPRSILTDIGIRPVIYGKKDFYYELSDEDKPYFQFSGRNTSQIEQKGDSNTNNWISENEWRFSGDLDFRSFAKQICLLLPSRSEAQRMQSDTGYRSLPLSSNKR